METVYFFEIFVGSKRPDKGTIDKCQLLNEMFSVLIKLRVTMSLESLTERALEQFFMYEGKE